MKMNIVTLASLVTLAITSIYAKENTASEVEIDVEGNVEVGAAAVAPTLEYSPCAVQDSDGKHLEYLDCTPARFAPNAFSSKSSSRVYAPYPDNGCDAFGNVSFGGIAVVRRGVCNFNQKTDFAEDAMASGLVVVNNVPGVTQEELQGSKQTKLPVMFMSLEDGETLLEYARHGTGYLKIDYDSSWNSRRGAARGKFILAENPTDARAALGTVYALEELARHVDVDDLPEQLAPLLEVIYKHGKDQLEVDEFTSSMTQLGLHFAQLGEVESAVELAEEFPENVKLNYQIGAELVLHNHFKEGRKLLKVSKDLDPRKFVSHLAQAKWMVDQGKSDKALRELRAFLTLFESNKEANVLISDIYIKKKDAKGLHYLDMMVFLDPKDTVSQFKAAKLAQAVGQLDRARVDAQAVLEMEGDSPSTEVVSFLASLE